MASHYQDCSDQELADSLQRELNLRLMNDTAAREKVSEAIRRLSNKKESSEVKQLRAENKKLRSKLNKVKSIIED